jgi:hypothetical protein
MAYQIHPSCLLLLLPAPILGRGEVQRVADERDAPRLFSFNFQFSFYLFFVWLACISFYFVFTFFFYSSICNSFSI